MHMFTIHSFPSLSSSSHPPFPSYFSFPRPKFKSSILSCSTHPLSYLAFVKFCATLEKSTLRPHAAIIPTCNYFTSLSRTPHPCKMTPVLSPSLSNLTLDTFTVPNSPSSLNADALLTLVFGILATVVGITGVMFQAFRAIRKTPAPSTRFDTLPLLRPRIQCP